MIDINLVKQKISEIKKYYKELEPILEKPARAIIEDYRDLRIVERSFQLMVDTALGINTHIISVKDFNVPDDYQNTFTVLGESKVLPMEFALKIADSVGLRNMLVHKYGKVDLKRMIDEIKADISQYLEYLKLIDSFLQKQA